MNINELSLVSYSNVLFVVIDTYDDYYVVSSLENFIRSTEPYITRIKITSCGVIDLNEKMNMPNIKEMATNFIERNKTQAQQQLEKQNKTKQLRKRLLPGHELIRTNELYGTKEYFLGKHNGKNYFMVIYQDKDIWVNSTKNFTMSIDDIGERLSKDEVISKLKECKSYGWNPAQTQDTLIKAITNTEW